MTTEFIAFTEEEKQSARNSSITAYLRSKGYDVKKSGSEFVWDNGNEKITIRDQKWFNHYSGKGGDPIDFLEKFFDFNYQDAMLELLRNRNECPIAKRVPKKEFCLPEPFRNNAKVIEYLTSKRKITEDVVNEFINSKMIYEALQYHNAVFVGYDNDGKPRHAALHGIYNGKVFKGCVSDSKPEYTFHWNGNDDSLFIFEAPIDMLSYISLHKEDWKRHSYSASCGVGNRNVWQMIADNKDIRRIFICYDNDITGQSSASELQKSLISKGYDAEIMKPKAKDWNEDLIFGKDDAD